MICAILADIHGNLPALDAVLADVDAAGVDAVYHLGDLVGYGPWPDEVVARLRERAVAGVGGNYDTTVATDHGHCGCRYEDPRQAGLAHESYEWTRRRVRPETRRFLASLPFRLDLRPLGGHAAGPTVVLLHGAPTLNTLYWDEDRPDDFCRRMASRAGARAGDAIAFGHTHVPWQREVDGVHFANAGSVGRPKDGDPRACWLRLEVTGDAVRASFRRVAYDVEAVQRALRQRGLPGALGEALATGGSPVPSAAGRTSGGRARPDPGPAP